MITTIFPVAISYVTAIYDFLNTWWNDKSTDNKYFDNTNFLAVNQLSVPSFIK